MPNLNRRFAETYLPAGPYQADGGVPAQDPSDPTFAKAYLEATTTETYLDSINPDTTSGLEEFTAKIAPLHRHLPAARAVISVGVGSGEELVALAQQYDSTKTEIYGIDLSTNALDTARETLDRHGVSAHLLEGSATDLPVEDESVSGTVLSAIMHEVYSYMPNGKGAWTQAIAQAALKGSLGSKVLLRDFAAPSRKGLAQLTLKTDEALTFYKYFSQFYRTFRGGNGIPPVVDYRLPDSSDFPAAAGTTPTVEVDLDNVAELLLHFKTGWADNKRGLPVIDNPCWKEINETYLPPNPEMPGIIPMTISRYAQMAVRTGNQALRAAGHDATLSVAEQTLSGRPKVARFLGNHFGVLFLDDRSASSEAVIADSTNKMELVLSKDALH